MSSFSGRMKEYERISIDRFDGKNLQSTVYFLSHLHEDHTVGLATPLFFKHLKTSKNVFLYCSDVTEVLIQASKKYRHLVPYIKKISINTPTTIEVPDPLFDEVETVTVTLLPAFHCPGSVMCLFEGHEGTVLYTGDFRWEHFNIEQMYHLRSGESVKKVKSLYVDTTFCSPENLYIPSRQHCIDAVYKLVYEWINQSPQHVVYLSLRAQYGHEPLLNAVASRLNKKVHVASHKVEVYNQIQEFLGNFTSDGSSTQIHACGKEMQNIDGEIIPCRHRHDPDKILSILPTTMYFTQFQHLTLDKIVRKVGDQFYRVCYAFHSSYTEIKDLISYLRPENVYPNVKPPNDASLAVVQQRLNRMLADCLSSSDIGVEPSATEVTELGTLKTSSRRTAGKRKPSTPSDTESLDFGTPTKLQKTESQSQRQTRSRGCNSNVTSSQESEPVVSPVKGRGRGRGRQTRSSQDIAAETPKRVSTRLRSKQNTSEEVPQKKTPAKRQRSESPDIFLTPSKSEVSDISEKQSSYSGSHGDESEMDLTLSQKSLDLQLALDMKGDNIDSWAGGSFLSAVSSQSTDDAEACVCVLEDIEQTDENFEDVSQIEAEKDDEGGLNLEDVEKMDTPVKTEITSSSKKGTARKGRRSGGKTISQSSRDRKLTDKNDKNKSSDSANNSSETLPRLVTDKTSVNIKLLKCSENLDHSEPEKENKDSVKGSQNESDKNDINESKSENIVKLKQDSTEKSQKGKKSTATIETDNVNQESKSNLEKTSCNEQVSLSKIPLEKSGEQLESKETETKCKEFKENKSEKLDDKTSYEDRKVKPDSQSKDVLEELNKISVTEEDNKKFKAVDTEQSVNCTNLINQELDTAKIRAFKHTLEVSTDEELREKGTKKEDTKTEVLETNGDGDKGDDMSDEELSKAIAESLTSDQEMFEDAAAHCLQADYGRTAVVEESNTSNKIFPLYKTKPGISSEKSEKKSRVTADNLDLKNSSTAATKDAVEENKIEISNSEEIETILVIDSENKTNGKDKTQSDDSDSLQDTPPGEILVGEGQCNDIVEISELQNVSGSKSQLYTRHWPVKASGTKQERRRKRKRKQKRKKYAAINGIIYYDSDCEIFVQEEEKVEIDLTCDTVYDENDFEYDLRKKLKKAKIRSRASPEKLPITVFKTEKMDDDHLYGGVKVRETYLKKKGVNKLKFSRRSSFELGEETPEDKEFINELEEALAKKGCVESVSESKSKIQPDIDPLYEGLLDAKPLPNECDNLTLETVDNEEQDSVNSNDGCEQLHTKGSDIVKNNDCEKETNEICDENRKRTDEIEPIRENNIKRLTDDDTGKEGISNKRKGSNVKYTETKEGKKLMRISFEGRRKTNEMPKQNYLGNDIFIDLSVDDDTPAGSKSNIGPASLDVQSENSQSIVANIPNEIDKSNNRFEPERSAMNNSGNAITEVGHISDENNKSSEEGKTSLGIGKTSQSDKELSEKLDKRKKKVSDSCSMSLSHRKKIEAVTSGSEHHSENDHLTSELSKFDQEIKQINAADPEKGEISGKNKGNEISTGKNKTKHSDEIEKYDKEENLGSDSSEKEQREEIRNSMSKELKIIELDSEEESDIIAVEESPAIYKVQTDKEFGDSKDKEKSKQSISENEKNVVCLTDDEMTRSSTDSGEWLSCAKAMQNREHNRKKSKRKRTSLPKSVVNPKTKPCRLEKDPAENVIDKYLTHIISADNISENCDKLDDEKLGINFSKEDSGKLENNERLMHDTDYEDNNQTKRNANSTNGQKASPTSGLDEDIISLNNDSELDEEIFKKIDSPLNESSCAGLQSKKKNICIDITDDDVKAPADDNYRRNYQQDPKGRADSNAGYSHHEVTKKEMSRRLSHDPRNESRKDKGDQRWIMKATSNMQSFRKDRNSLPEKLQSQGGKQIEIVHQKKSKNKPRKKSRFSSGEYPVPAREQNFKTYSEPQNNLAQPKYSFSSKSSFNPTAVNTVPSVYNVPPPGMNAVSFNPNRPPPSLNILPYSTLPDTNVFPPVSFVSSSVIAKTSYAQPSFSSVPTYNSAQPFTSLSAAEVSKPVSDTFISSLPGPDPSQSLLSSVSLPSTVVGTLNAVLDVILNAKAPSVSNKETTLTSGNTQSAVSEVIHKLDAVQRSLKSKDMENDSKETDEDNRYQRTYQRDPTLRSDDDLRYSRLEITNREVSQRASHPVSQNSTDLRYDTESREVADDVKQRHDRIRDRSRDQRYRQDDPRYDRDVNRYEDSDRYRRIESDRPYSPYHPYERERAREYDRERAWADYYRRLEDSERRRHDFERDYYERDYYREDPYRSRPDDSYYDYPDHPHPRCRDPYYDRRSPGDPYYDRPPRDPYYDSPSVEYDDRYKYRHARPRSPTRRNASEYSYEGSQNTPVSSRQTGKLPSSRNHPRKCQSLLDPPFEHPDDTESRTVASAQSRYLPEEVKPDSQKKQTNTLQRHAQEQEPPRPQKSALVLSRGKKVASFSGEIVEKTHSSIGFKTLTTAKTDIDYSDSSRPAFCTGLSPASMQKTGFKYRHSVKNKR